MKVLDAQIDLQGFWDRLAKSKVSILFLDYDGTIAPFKVERDEAVPYPWVPGVLNRILNTGRTRLVIISGREISSIQNLLRLVKPVEIWGCHGREHLLENGMMESEALSKAAKKVLSSAHEWIEVHGLSDNMEEKNGCLALHFRGMKQGRADELERQASKAFNAMLPGSDMELDRFNGGIELRTAGIDKGQAVKKVLAEYDTPPPCAYLGDDLTDEDAFVAIKGKGLAVLVREEIRPTSADVWIRPPEELRAFLEKWSIQTEGK